MNGEKETKETSKLNSEAAEKEETQQAPGEDEVSEAQIEPTWKKGLHRIVRLFRSLWGKKRLFNAVTLFCRQLSTLVAVGIPLLKCLQILHQRTSNRKLKTIIHDISQDIEQGTAFSAALEKHPKVFSLFFVNMMKVAEKGGSLDEALKVVADVLEQEELRNKKVWSALYYPITTLIVGVLVIGILIVSIIPKFADLYARQDFTVDLPWITKILIDYGNFRTFVILVAVVIIIILLFRFVGKKSFYDRVKIKLPLFGSLFMDMYVARFARNFGTLVQGGVPMLQALDVVKQTSENVAIAEAVDLTIQHVERGGRLEQPLREADVFPDVVVDMLAIGEEAGKLDIMLFKIAELYDGEIERAINTLPSLIQPILIVILGLMTAFIAAAMFWPYFRLADFAGF
jgi:type IV pilus assembly protein PilC